MNIAYSTTMTDVAPDTFVSFPGGGDMLWGPRTIVWVVFADIDPDQTFDVRVYQQNDLLVASAYVIEFASVPGDPTASAHTGFQSTPLPLVNGNMGTNFALTIVGGTKSNHVYVAAIEL